MVGVGDTLNCFLWVTWGPVCPKPVGEIIPNQGDMMIFFNCIYRTSIV